MRPGGVTSDGLILEYTEIVDNPLTWLFKLYSKNKELSHRILKVPSCSKLKSIMMKIASGNSADGKRELAEWIRRKKYDVEGTQKISFKKILNMQNSRK